MKIIEYLLVEEGVAMSKVIAIDGPAGAGKSTISRLLALKLDYRYLDSGAMYRAITWLAIINNLSLDNEYKLSLLAERAEIRFLPPDEKGIPHIILNNNDITSEIRKPIIDKNVSRVAMVKGVREEMVKQQRKMAREGGIVMDGRDIGSRVLPDADFKFFVTASLEERARRRYKEIEDSNNGLKIAEIKAKIAERDKLDMEREHSPLIKTADAILIDTTYLSIDEVVSKMINIIKGNEEDE